MTPAEQDQARYISALTEAGWAVPQDNARLLVALYVRLMDGKPEPVSPANDTTIDGVPVTIGMRVWDYDLEPTTVEEIHHLDPHSGSWWYSTSNRGLFDAKRMWFRHPSTGVRA